MQKAFYFTIQENMLTRWAQCPCSGIKTKDFTRLQHKVDGKENACTSNNQLFHYTLFPSTKILPWKRMRRNVWLFYTLFLNKRKENVRSKQRKGSSWIQTVLFTLFAQSAQFTKCDVRWTNTSSNESVGYFFSGIFKIAASKKNRRYSKTDSSMPSELHA